MEDKIIANFLFLFSNFAYTYELNKPQHIPFEKIMVIVATGLDVSIIKLLGSPPDITTIKTIKPNIKPKNEASLIPKIAPAIIIGIKVKVIGKAPILI